MATIMQLKGTETACNTTPSTYANNKIIRIINTSTTLFALITRVQVSNGNNSQVFTLGPNLDVIVEKLPTDTLQSNNAATQLLAVPISYRN